MFDFINSNLVRWQSPSQDKMADDYLRQLEIIRQIRETITAKDELNLPQICVIGDQSSGKSSFLSRLTGVSFPTAAKMCTKAATVVTCKRDEALSLPHYEIECCDKPGTYKVVKCTAAAITETQDKLLGVKGGTTGDDNRIISDKSIKLRVTSPHVIYIIIVDLPGIQHAGPTKNAITALIEANIKKPETLNLIVSEAKQDAELTKAIELAEKYDPNHERTIRVLSKFDNFDTHETRKRAVDLVKKDSRSGSFGPHAVISIGSDGKLRSNQHGHKKEKKQLMEEYSIPESRAGIICLEARLQPLFASLVKKNLPFLKEKATSLLFETHAHLDKVGKEPLSPMDMVFKCHSCLLGAVKALDIDLTERSFLPLKKGICDVHRDSTFDFSTSSFKLNAFECILFQGKEPFDDAAMRIREMWEPIVNDYIKSAKGVALESMHVLTENAATKIYAPMISVIRAECEYHIAAVVHGPCLCNSHGTSVFF
jgi:GTPase SAR1 family protein